MLEFIQILILLAILYFIIPEKKKKEVKKRAKRKLPKKSELIEWTPPEDETSSIAKRLIKSLHGKYNTKQ